MLKYCCSVVLLCIATLTLSAHLPSNFETCNISDEECLKAKMEDAISKLASGNKDLGIPNLDPLERLSLAVDQKQGPVSLSQKYTNGTFYGLSKAKIEKFNINLDHCNIYFKILFPSFRITAHYVLKGNILTFPINGEGDCEGLYDRIQVAHNVTCEKYNENETEYLRFVDVKVAINWGTVIFHMGEIIKGNQQLSKEIEKSLNEDPKDFLTSFQPELENYLGENVKNIANQLFTQVPLKEIFKY